MQDELMPDENMQAEPTGQPPQSADQQAFGKTAPIESDGETETEEEQQQYDMLVSRALNQMHGDGKSNIVNMLSVNKSPAKGMGQASALLLRGLVSSAKEAGTEITDKVIQAATIDIVEYLNELGEVTGVYEYTDDDEADSEMKDAIVMSVKNYTDAARKAGEITPEMENSAKKQLQTQHDKEAGQQAPAPSPVAPAESSGGLINSLMQNGV
ncbi:MAG: hypothetical protein KAS93_00250 [Gammaproteobacteria bacterium]|nr:hypothetical protein [Gammaproteobacteria bacterium]